LSFYQPKLALMLTIVVLAFLAELLQWPGTAASLVSAVRNSLANTACVISGAALYFAELRLTKWFFPPPDLDYFAMRTQVNSLGDMLASIKPVLANLRDRLLFETNIFPHALQWVLAALVALAVILGVMRILTAGAERRFSVIALALFLGAVALTPFCLY